MQGDCSVVNQPLDLFRAKNSDLWEHGIDIPRPFVKFPFICTIIEDCRKGRNAYHLGTSIMFFLVVSTHPVSTNCFHA